MWYSLRMSANGKYRAVLFDMDETLIQHQRTGLELIHLVYEEFRDRLPGVEEPVFGRTLWKKANDMWSMMFDGVLPGSIARPYTFKNTLRELQADLELSIPMLESFERHALEATRMTPGADQVLAALRGAGFRTGVVTNGFTCAQTRKAEHHGLHLATEFVLPSETAGFHKPDPRIFRHALNLIDCEPHETLFVGDNLVADIRGALGAGLSAALFDPRNEKEADLAKPDAPRPTLILRELSTVLGHVGLPD